MNTTDPTEYTVVSKFVYNPNSERDVKEFTDIVEKNLQLGWRIVQGATLLATVGNGYYMTQTMVRSPQDKMVNKLAT